MTIELLSFQSGGEHDSSFDHEAIIGSAKEAAEFDQLSPKEAKQRLTILVSEWSLFCAYLC